MKKTKTIKALKLDKDTSHGGWPAGKSRGWIDDGRTVAQIIADYLKAMGLTGNPEHARLSESDLRKVIRKVLTEIYNY